MAQLTVPADLASELQRALRWYGTTGAGTEFYALIAAGIEWRPARVRELIAWAERRRVAVFGARLLSCMLAGFCGPGRCARMLLVRAELRRAAADVAEGREAPLLTGMPIHDWSGPPVLSLDGWSDGAGWELAPRIATTRYGSPADGMQPVLPATTLPSSPPAIAPSPRPSLPRGDWIRRAG